MKQARVYSSPLATTPYEKLLTKFAPDDKGCLVWKPKHKRESTKRYGKVTHSVTIDGVLHEREELSHRALFSADETNPTLLVGQQLHHMCDNTLCGLKLHLLPVWPYEHKQLDAAKARGFTFDQQRGLVATLRSEKATQTELFAS